MNPKHVVLNSTDRAIYVANCSTFPCQYHVCGLVMVLNTNIGYRFRR